MSRFTRIRWQGFRLYAHIEITEGRAFGAPPSITIKAPESAAFVLGFSGMRRFTINADILETMGNPATYARRILDGLADQAAQRRTDVIKQQLALF